jgi:hypothetical protein
MLRRVTHERRVIQEAVGSVEAGQRTTDYARGFEGIVKGDVMAGQAGGDHGMQLRMSECGTYTFERREIEERAIDVVGRQV